MIVLFLPCTLYFREEHVQFDMEPPEFPQCNEMEVDLKKQEETWALFDDFNSGRLLSLIVYKYLLLTEMSLDLLCKLIVLNS